MYTVTSAARMSSASFERELWNEAAVPWKSDCRLGGKLRFLTTFSMSSMAVPSEALFPRLKETVTEGNCPWWLMESASVMVEAWVKALRGIAFAPTEAMAVLGVVPAADPPLTDELPAPAVPESTEAGGLRTADEGVYLVDAVSALEPAAAEADEENDVAAPAPLAPDEALDWMYRSPRFLGFCAHCGWVSSTTWYWLSCL